MNRPSARRSHVPARAGSCHFTRTHLHARLDRAARMPVTLLVADEGLGKTTLVRDYLRTQSIAHLWFSGSAGRGGIDAFVRAFAGTFAASRPAMARSSAAAAAHLAAGNAPDAVRWAAEHLSGLDGCVVLDGLHHVLNEPVCAAFLAGIIDAQGNGIRWILTTRDASALPVPRWLAAARASLPLESADMRVGADELRLAFAAAGHACDETVLQALISHARGWILPLAVACDAADPLKLLDYSIEHETFYRRLADAAFAALNQSDCAAACELALIERFDGQVLAALEFDDALARTLVRLRLVSSAGNGSYAFYEPVRRVLLDLIDNFESRTRDAVFDRAALALIYADRWDDSVVLRVRAGDETQIAATIAARGFRAIDGGAIATLERGLAAVSEPVLRAFPIALAVKAALSSLAGDLDVAEAWFRIAAETASDADRRTVVVRYGMDLVRRERDDVIALLEEESRHGGPVDADADAALWALLGTAYVQQRRVNEGRAAAQRALERLPGVTDGAVRARVLHQASYVALEAENYDEAKALAARSLARADEAYLFDVSARALSVLFNVAVIHDTDVQAARSALERLREAGRKAGSPGLQLYAILNMYVIETDAGNVEALDHLGRDLNAMDVMLTPMVAKALLPTQAIRAAWDGDFAHALDLINSTVAPTDDDARATFRLAEIALYAAAGGKLDDAREAVRLCREASAALDPSQHFTLRSAAYLALVSLLFDDTQGAAAAMNAARTHAENVAGMSALVAAVTALVGAREGSPDAVSALAEALDDLDAHHLGGISRLISRLPNQLLDAAQSPSLRMAAS